jgi:phosphoribosylformimino-5-aminoimidazole carboxamide ribotide isomerase
MEIYPAIDLKDGQCVRLLYGDFDTVHTVAPDPVAVAVGYREAGAKIVHVVDLDGAKDGQRKNADLIRAICQALIPDIGTGAKPALVELGGGLRCMKDIEEADALGVHRFVIGSAALESPAFVREAIDAYGDRIAVGIDAKDGLVRTHGWVRDSGRDEVEFAKEAASWGVKTIIYTDIGTDGALAGPSLERLAVLREALPNVTLVASGGVTTVGDVTALRKMGCNAAIAGKALYTGDLPLEGALFEGRFGQLFDKEPLIPAIVQHAEDGTVLMLAYMNAEALMKTLKDKRAAFYSRSRKCLWVKGETSGNFLDVVSAASDCDGDTILLRVKPHGPVCHTGAPSCFYNEIEIL